MMRLIAGLLLLLLSLGAAADTSAQPGANSQCFQALQGRLNDMSDRLTRLENQASSQGILSLLNQLETLESEVAKLRGAQDELAHRQQLADQRQQKVLADFDQRLRQLQQEMARPAVTPATRAAPPAATAGASAPPGASVPTAVPTTPTGTTPAATTPAATVTPPAAAPVTPTQVPQVSNLDVETKAYEAALNLVRSADYNGAVSTLSGFIKQYPNTKLAGNAIYWLGFSYYALGDYKNAQLTQQRLLDNYPQHSKVPDAMIGLARADIQLGQMDQANQLLNRVIARYPNTPAAEMAQKMQTLLK